jgi:prevent-host-death family protein
MKVNIHKAKTQFSRLIDRVSEGERIIIAKAGKPVARLVPIRARSKRRIFGQDRGKLTVPEDFNAPLPGSVLRDFEG